MKRTVLAADLSILVAIALALGVAYWQERVATSRIEVFGGFAEELGSKNYSAAEQILLKALPSPEFADPFSQSDLHHRLADLQLTYLGNESAAANNYLAALSDIAGQTSPQAIAQSADISRQLGILEDNRGRPAEALKHFEASLEGVQALGFWDDETSLYESLGIVHSNLKHYERADFYLGKALARIESARPLDDDRLALILNNIASGLQKRGEAEKALPHVNRAIQVVEQSDSDRLKAALYDTTASVYSDLGRNEEALRFIEKALALGVETESVSAYLQETYGVVLSRLDRKDEACASWRKSFQLYENTENETDRDAVGKLLASGRC